MKNNQRILNPKEALQHVQLEHAVDDFRTLVFEYMLVRASLTTNVVEKKAWWILASLMVFVERNHRFPRLKEQVKFLKTSADSIPELPRLQLTDLLDQKEVPRQMQVIRRQLVLEKEKL